MLCCRKLFGLLLLISAGCATAPRQFPPERTEVSEQQIVVAEPAPIRAAQPVPRPAPLPAALPPPKLRTNDFRPRETWISLDQWSRSQGFGPSRRIGSEIPPWYSCATTNGPMVIKVGSQSAAWNGLELRLGFAPQMIEGHPYVHSLDVRKNLTPLSDNSLHIKTNTVLVIDPGHGGMDTGAKSVFEDRFEKELTLDWARRLQSLLTAGGWTVLLTRTNDVNLSLSNRVAFATRHKADLFLSLHFNSAFPNREQAGLETYCLTPAGMPSNLTRGFSDNASLTFPNNTFDSENLEFAVRLHRALLNVNGHADRGVRRARFLGVLQGQTRPAILVEGGYLSNPAEARRIAQPAYRQRLAEALARALLTDSQAATAFNLRAPPPLAVHLEAKPN